jgi:hypothetical protein
MVFRQAQNLFDTRLQLYLVLDDVRQQSSELVFYDRLLMGRDTFANAGTRCIEYLAYRPRA